VRLRRWRRQCPIARIVEDVIVDGEIHRQVVGTSFGDLEWAKEGDLLDP
jgi:hypothetical protein